MSKLKHTPGPWNVERLENNHPVIISDEDITIAYPQFSLETMGHNEANARLIAAVPEMLEVLIEFCKVNCTECNIVCGTHCALYDSKTVIERATGLKIEEVLVK